MSLDKFFDFWDDISTPLLIDAHCVKAEGWMRKAEGTATLKGRVEEKKKNWERTLNVLYKAAFTPLYTWPIIVLGCM